MAVYMRAALTAQVPIIKPGQRHNKTQKQYKYRKKNKEKTRAI
jgi:hypothetical protein